MSKTIAITGASGFTGGAIARHFHAKGWSVLGFGRRANPDLPEAVNYQQWDIADGTIDPGQPVDCVLHSAAMVDDRGNRDDFIRVNVSGTRHVLDSFRDAGQFIYISSSSVYDPFTEKINIAEDFTYGSRYLNAYGESKMLAEKIVLADARNNKVIVRPRAIYGEGDTTLLPRLLNLRRGSYMMGFGSGNNETSITYIGNFCHAIELLTKHQFESEIFNIADTETITQKVLLERIAHLMEWEFKPVFLPLNIMRPLARLSDWLAARGIQTQLSLYGLHNLSETFTLDTAKAQELLDYQPPFSQSEAFARVRMSLISTGYS